MRNNLKYNEVPIWGILLDTMIYQNEAYCLDRMRYPYGVYF